MSSLFAKALDEEPLPIRGQFGYIHPNGKEIWYPQIDVFFRNTTCGKISICYDRNETLAHTLIDYYDFVKDRYMINGDGRSTFSIIIRDVNCNFSYSEYIREQELYDSLNHAFQGLQLHG